MNAKPCGPITGCNLSRLESLDRPFETDDFGYLRPVFSREETLLSLELAAMTYTLSVEPWMAAGWDDFSIQVDDQLQSGLVVPHSASGQRMRDIMNNLRMWRMKVALRERNPISQVMSALRQRERSDTIKAVCMMHPLPGGRWLAAIGFMGTGKRFYDWFSNMRFTTEGGFHKGFHQLCDCFESGLEDIVFPRTARALELGRLTLGDVLQELRSPNSRFKLWMAGHSQGSAVMQIFTHRLLTDWQVLPQNVAGYGFASPTVATGQDVADLAAYPLMHLLNSDDVVTRAGANAHLGLCLEYPAGDALRQAVYDLSPLPADVEARHMLQPFYEALTDTPSILLHMSALLVCLAQEKGEDGLDSLMSRRWAIPMVDRMLLQAGGKAMNLLNAVLKNAREGYRDLTGHPMDSKALSQLCDRFRPVVRALPVRRLMAALASLMMPPHHINHEPDHTHAAYVWITQNGLDSLRPFVWQIRQQGLPQRRYVQPPARTARRRGLPPMRGAARLSYSAARRSHLQHSRPAARKAGFSSVDMEGISNPGFFTMGGK